MTGISATSVMAGRHEAEQSVQGAGPVVKADEGALDGADPVIRDRRSSRGSRSWSWGERRPDLVRPVAAVMTKASPRTSTSKSAGPLRKCSSKTATPMTRLTTGSTDVMAGRLKLSGPAW